MTRINYETSTNPISYPAAMDRMAAIIANIEAKTSSNTIWFLEHEPLYTRGVSAEDCELLNDSQLPVYPTNRGGKFVYHGPGQRVVYLMLNLKEVFHPNPPDIRQYVFWLEESVIKLLDKLGVKGMRCEGNPGVWVKPNDHLSPKKIAFIGVKLHKGITSHGLAFNICPDLRYFNSIVPCGIQGCGITSLKQLGIELDAASFDQLFKTEFEKLIGQGD